MNTTTFAKYKLGTRIFVILIFIFGIVGSAAATSMSAAVTGNLAPARAMFFDPVTYEDVLITSVGCTDPVAGDNNKEFVTMTYELTTSTLGRLTSTLLKLNPEFLRAGSVKIAPLPDMGVSGIQPLPVDVISPLEPELFDFSGSDDLLDTFTAHADIPRTWYDDSILSHVPVPEPGTIFLFVTSFGLLGGYGWWRRKKNGAVRAAIALTTIPVREQRAREERMVMVGKMAGEVMHDVKNALTGIRTCTEVLGYDDLDSDERKEWTQMIATEIDRIVGMTQDLLEFSQGQQKPLKLQTCSAKELLDELLALKQCHCACRQISIQPELQYTGRFQADVEKLKRVFANIVDNACDAMPDGGSLTIRSRLVPKASRIQFEFTDTGCGMSPDLQARFLEPFVTEGKAHGTGLGMAIVKDLLDEHHARLDVQSAVGQGTTIRILLPLNSSELYEAIAIQGT